MVRVEGECGGLKDPVSLLPRSWASTQTPDYRKQLSFLALVEQEEYNAFLLWCY